MRLLASVGFVLWLPLFSHAQIDKFIGYPFLVEDLQQPNADRFVDVTTEWDNLGEADSIAPSPQNFGWLGVCFKKTGEPCLRTINGREQIMEAFYRSLGMRERIGRIDLSGVPEGEMEVSTTWIESGDSINVEVIKSIGNAKYKGSYRIRQFGRLSQRKVKLNFPRSASGLREPYGEQTLHRKELANSIIQIAGGPIDLKNLLGRIVKSGTGFFISSSGLLLTNNHVIASYPDCLKYLRCQLTVRKVQNEKVTEEYEVMAEIYAHSEPYDFALLKLDTPFVPQPIEIEADRLGSELLTAGFPGDKLNARRQIDLTFAVGDLAGFKSKSFATTVYVYPGASGSPMLNRDNLKLIGIVSDVQGQPQKGRGNPSIVRPIDIIDEDYGIREYLTGEKQARIDQLLQDIQSTDIISSAKQLLDRYVKENSLYRIDRLHEIAIAHRSETIRRSTFESLQQLNLLRGPLQ